MDEPKITSLIYLDGAEILEPGDIDIGDEDSFYIYQFDEVKYVMGESIQHNGTCESIKKLIKERPTAVITIYKIEHLLEYHDFEDVVKRMIELDTAIKRKNKLENLLK